MYGGTITGNTASVGGGVYVGSGSFGNYGGSIYGNSSSYGDNNIYSMYWYFN